MAMSDCIKCWNTPCSCGWDYKGYSAYQLSKHIAQITQYRTKDEAKAILENALKIIEKSGNWQGEEIRKYERAIHPTGEKGGLEKKFNKNKQL